MGYPRALTVNPEAPGFYHCMSRCVRRAWLCGEDPLSGRNFDHRRDWRERRLIDLSKSFAVGLYAWAVMSNHCHVVLRTDPKQPWRWSDEEVAMRWARLTRTLKAESESRVQARAHELLDQPERLEELRHRLGSLSWFMRFLNECIARMANVEDECTGRFWEGRYQCKVLLDEPGVLAAMAYVDLNPIRAGLADDLAGSDYTSMQRRLRDLAERPETGTELLMAMEGEVSEEAPVITLANYIDLVDDIGRQARSEKRGRIGRAAPSALAGIRGSPQWWSSCAIGLERIFRTAVGTRTSLCLHAAATGRKWLWGSAAS